MVKIEIEINSCTQCPHLKTMNKYSSDGWDHMEDWCFGFMYFKVKGFDKILKVPYEV